MFSSSMYYQSNERGTQSWEGRNAQIMLEIGHQVGQSFKQVRRSLAGSGLCLNVTIVVQSQPIVTRGRWGFSNLLSIERPW